ncbi:MAG: MarR family transcriptional regulator [Firmicutes bacterium]|nr:MarR family transcriptional regulator [Bacillota bacterium]
MRKVGNDKKIQQLDQKMELAHRLFHTYLSDSTNISLSLAQMFLLKLLSEKGTCTPSSIAQEMGVTSGAITSLADRLHKQELISRERSESDRRVVMIKLTSKGEEAFKAVDAERMKRVVEIFSQLTEKDIDDLIRIYDKLIALLEKANN